MTAAGKAAFAEKKSVYIPVKITQDAREWHLSHRMPKNASLSERIQWHKGHTKHCNCRPLPESMKRFF